MITYNGMDLPEGVKVLDIRRPLLPPQVNSLLGIDSRNGSFFYNNKSDVLAIEIDIMAHAEDMVELRGVLRDFAGFIKVDEPKQLIMQDEPDKFVKAIVDGDTGLENFFRVGKGTLTMLVPDPFYYALEDDIYQYDDTAEHTFNKQGNAESFPIVEIQGSNDGGSITFESEGFSVTYSGELNDGEVLVYDTDLLTGYVEETSGEKRSAIPYLNSLDFPVLHRGSNTVKVTTSGGAVLYNYSIRCNSRWL